MAAFFMRDSKNYALIVILSIIVFSGCSTHTTVPAQYSSSAKREKLAVMGHTVQVGSFLRVENAARFARLLNDNGLDAYYFINEKGLYRVRFGNFISRKCAREKAEILKFKGIIDEFYIVSPTDYPVTKRCSNGEYYLRGEIVKTAKNFIGVPYLWGGTSCDKGFDCSGLTMSVYKLNGFNLPRTAREQFKVGEFIKQNDLTSGDLVFFDTPGSRGISHVGVYAGNGKFIHAPGRGKRVRIDSLSSSYYRKYFSGGRSFL